MGRNRIICQNIVIAQWFRPEMGQLNPEMIKENKVTVSLCKHRSNEPGGKFKKYKRLMTAKTKKHRKTQELLLTK